MQIQNTTANENLDSWQEKKYAEFYAEEYAFLKRRVSQGAVNANDIAGTLQSLYIVDDNNLDGRSLIAQLSISASISAYEAILEELKSNTQETHL